MAIDKDLFGTENKVHSPDTCCILPQTQNVLLTNCKKHYFEGENRNNVLPLGIHRNEKSNTYYGVITFTGLNKILIFTKYL